MAKANILIVEDDGIVALDIGSRLKNFGYSVSATVSSGKEAIKKVKENHPDLVLMDIVLQDEMDGIEAADKIRTQFNIPIVYLTAYADEKLLDRAKLTEPFGYIIKPFEDRELHNVIEIALYKHKAESALQKAHDELEQRVEERTFELKKANEQLKQKIEERKIAEEASRESEERYRLLFETMVSGFSLLEMIYDENNKPIDCRYVTVNPSHRQHSGLHPSDIIGKTAKEVFGLKDEWIEKYGYVDKTGEPLEIEDYVEGLGKWFRVIAYRPEPGFVAITFENITERKQAEKQLQKSKAMLQSVFDGISEPLILLDKEMVVEMLNQAAAKYYKVEYQDAIGRPCYLACKGRTDPCEGCDIPSNVLSGKHSSFERKSLMEPDKIENVVVYPVRDKDSESWSAIIRISDITEQKKMEQELIQADKMIALGILVSGVAHEINNPNNFIMLNAPLLGESWKSAVPILEEYYKKNGDFNMGGLPYSEMRDEVPNLFSGIEEGSKRIKQIVQDLKEFSRQETGKMDQSVDVNTVIERSIRLGNTLIRKATLKFKIEYGQNLPSLKGNSQKLEQVMINLIQNACQALSDKEKEIVVSSSYDMERGGIIVEVRDEGVGIPAEALPNIMNPFFTTRRSQGGTGLGLSVSANIVKDHGGNIKVKSDRGIGTTFTVFLPTERMEKLTKILVVDDDDGARKLIIKTLSAEPVYMLKEASSGAEACIKLGKDRPDLIILDVMMPDMDGVEVCRLIQKDPELSLIKVIVITGFPDSSQVKKIAEMGFNNILPKPFSIADFTKMVNTVLKDKADT